MVEISNVSFSILRQTVEKLVGDRHLTDIATHIASQINGPNTASNN